MDLRTWVIAEHEAGFGRFDQAITPHVPQGRWRERAGGDGASIAWLVFHLSYHQDLAVATALRGQPPLLEQHRHEVGLDRFAPHEGLGEAEQPDVTAALVLPAVVDYARAVHEATAAWLRAGDLTSLDHSPPAVERLGDLAGVTDAAVPWLYAMWRGKPGAWFVQWEAIGHVQGHVGEMVSVRSRLGLTPF